MTVTQSPEYRTLQRDSSNDIIRHDARRGDGELALAVVHARNAGSARLRMGDLAKAAGDYARAAADWLSAGACFYLATDLTGLEEAVQKVEALRDADMIPPERVDLMAALSERIQQRDKLRSRLESFRQEYPRLANATATPAKQLRDFLSNLVEVLPGFPNLHTAISLRAMRLGEFEVASRHLDFAEQLAPGNPQIESLRIALLLTSGMVADGVRRGRDLLARSPDLSHLRVLLAHAIAFPDKGNATGQDWEEAAQILGPMTKTDAQQGDADDLVPIALAATLQHGLRHESEYQRLLGMFNRRAGGTQAKAAIQFRMVMPTVFPTPDGPGATAPQWSLGHTSSFTDYDPIRSVVRSMLYPEFSLSS